MKKLFATLTLVAVIAASLFVLSSAAQADVQPVPRFTKAEMQSERWTKPMKKKVAAAMTNYWANTSGGPFRIDAACAVRKVTKTYPSPRKAFRLVPKHLSYDTVIGLMGGYSGACTLYATSGGRQR
jgi:hypothetical protein